MAGSRQPCIKEQHAGLGDKQNCIQREKGKISLFVLVESVIRNTCLSSHIGICVYTCTHVVICICMYTNTYIFPHTFPIFLLCKTPPGTRQKNVLSSHQTKLLTLCWLVDELPSMVCLQKTLHSVLKQVQILHRCLLRIEHSKARRTALIWSIKMQGHLIVSCAGIVH